MLVRVVVPSGAGVVCHRSVHWCAIAWWVCMCAYVLATPGSRMAFWAGFQAQIYGPRSLGGASDGRRRHHSGVACLGKNVSEVVEDYGVAALVGESRNALAAVHAAARPAAAR